MLYCEYSESKYQIYSEYSMFKNNKILTALLATSLIGVAATAQAETLSGTASLTVQNAFNLVETTQLSFGTITVAKATGTHDSNDDANMVLSPEGGTPVITNAAATGGAIGSIVAGNPATFDVTGAAPFTDLIVTMTAGTTLTNASAPPGNGAFTLSVFAARETGATSNIASLGTITTDLNGAKSFTLGSTLTIDGSADYIDGLYSGTYSVEVAY
jgi:hypothetical protein